MTETLLTRCDLPAYDQVKVWNADPTPQTTSRPARPRPRPGPRLLPGQVREVPREPLLRMPDIREWVDRNTTLLVWSRLCVVAALAAAMFWWPYGRSCGFGLSMYLAATLMITVGGLWVVACTWTERMVRTHAVAMVLALWGAIMITAQVLPRVGYARTEATWLCR
jgi:hypothetical protein